LFVPCIIKRVTPTRGRVSRWSKLGREDLRDAAAGRAAARDENDKIDGFRDQGARRRLADLHGQLFETGERGLSRVGV
jgi:hypothetical protein